MLCLQVYLAKEISSGTEFASMYNTSWTHSTGLYNTSLTHSTGLYNTSLTHSTSLYNTSWTHSTSLYNTSWTHSTSLCNTSWTHSTSLCNTISFAKTICYQFTMDFVEYSTQLNSLQQSSVSCNRTSPCWYHSYKQIFLEIVLATPNLQFCSIQSIEDATLN